MTSIQSIIYVSWTLHNWQRAGKHRYHLHNNPHKSPTIQSVPNNLSASKRTPETYTLLIRIQEQHKNILIACTPSIRKHIHPLPLLVPFNTHLQVLPPVPQSPPKAPHTLTTITSTVPSNPTPSIKDAPKHKHQNSSLSLPPSPSHAHHEHPPADPSDDHRPSPATVVPSRTS